MEPIKSETLAMISGKSQLEAASGFADTMLKAYQVRKQGEMQDMQKKQMETQQEEYQKNEQLRNQERQLNQQRMAFEIQNLPQEQQAKMKEFSIQSQENKTREYNATLANMATVTTAKQARKFMQENEAILRPYFPDDATWEAEKNAPYSAATWREKQKAYLNRTPEVLMKEIENDMALQLATAKAAATKKDVKDQFTMPSIEALNNQFANAGIDPQVADQGSLVVQNLIDISKNEDFPIRLSAPTATALTTKWMKEMQEDTGFFDSYPTGGIQAKAQQFMKDVAAGRGDPYIAEALQIPVETIQQIKLDHPEMSPREIYRQLEEYVRNPK